MIFLSFCNAKSIYCLPTSEKYKTSPPWLQRIIFYAVYRLTDNGMKFIEFTKLVYSTLILRLHYILDCYGLELDLKIQFNSERRVLYCIPYSVVNMLTAKLYNV